MKIQVCKPSMSKFVILTSFLGFGLLGLPVRAEVELAQPQEHRAVTPNAVIAQTPTQNLVEVAQGNPSFSTLVRAVEAAGLADTLANDGPFTVFAPTNAAFDELPDETLDFLLQPENRDLLSDILKYHVVPDRLPAEDIETGAVDTLNGGLAARVTPERIIINNGSITTPNVPAENGLIHVVDRVMIPIAVRDRLAQRMPVRGLW